MSELELFSTSQCPKCVKLAEYLDNAGVEFVKRVIDTDPEAETDALMFNIFAAPALRKGDEILRVKDLFNKDELQEKNINNFVK